MPFIDTAFTAIQDRLGTEIGVSDWQTVDQKMIDEFGTVTLDRQFIHNDPARAAAESPFGGTIAHGFLSLSLLSAMYYDALPFPAGVTRSINYGFDKLRFLSPVHSGTRVRGSFALIKADDTIA